MLSRRGSSQQQRKIHLEIVAKPHYPTFDSASRRGVDKLAAVAITPSIHEITTKFALVIRFGHRRPLVRSLQPHAAHTLLGGRQSPWNGPDWEPGTGELCAHARPALGAASCFTTRGAQPPRAPTRLRLADSLLGELGLECSYSCLIGLFLGRKVLLNLLLDAL